MVLWLHGSTTWTVDKDVKRLEHAVKSVVRSTCNATERHNPRSEGLRSRLEIECISEATRTGRLCWFGHKKRKKENDLGKCVDILRWKVKYQNTDQRKHVIRS